MLNLAEVLMEIEDPIGVSFPGKRSVMFPPMDSVEICHLCGVPVSRGCKDMEGYDSMDLLSVHNHQED